MISIIAAIDKKRGLGKDNKLLWHLPSDLKRFKALTTGHSVIMGRKTFESIGKALPNRTNIVITSQKDFKPQDTIITSSFEDALGKAGEGEIFVIGGGQVYRQAIEKADKLYLTLVDGEFGADTFFPDYSGFTIVNSEEGEENGIKYKYMELER